MPTNPEVLNAARTYHEAHKAALGLPEWTGAPATITADADAGRLAGLASPTRPRRRPRTTR